MKFRFLIIFLIAISLTSKLFSMEKEKTEILMTELSRRIESLTEEQIQQINWQLSVTLDSLEQQERTKKNNYFNIEHILASYLSNLKFEKVQYELNKMPIVRQFILPFLESLHEKLKQQNKIVHFTRNPFGFLNKFLPIVLSTKEFIECVAAFTKQDVNYIQRYLESVKAHLLPIGENWRNEGVFKSILNMITPRELQIEFVHLFFENENKERKNEEKNNSNTLLADRPKIIENLKHYSPAIRQLHMDYYDFLIEMTQNHNINPASSISNNKLLQWLEEFGRNNGIPNWSEMVEKTTTILANAAPAKL